MFAQAECVQSLGLFVLTSSSELQCVHVSHTGTQIDVPRDRITFHSQQKNHLLVQLTEVDPFGNYSSPHYKGTAMFYKVTRGQLEWRGDKRVSMDTKPLGDPVCKLSLTLPKVKRHSRGIRTSTFTIKDYSNILFCFISESENHQ